MQDEVQTDTGDNTRALHSTTTTRRNESFAVKYLLTVSASVIAVIVVYPLDIAKARLQIQGEHHQQPLDIVRGTKTVPPHHRGLLKTLIGIVTEEGALKLYRGLSAALLRHAVYSSRLVQYEFLREKVFKRDKDGHYPFWKSLATGSLAGAGGQFLASPGDLVKIRLQMEGRRILDGHKPRYKGPIDVFKSVVRSEGFLGLWKGWVPNCQRAGIVCIGELTMYDTTKQAILRNTKLTEGVLVHTMSSIVSGFVSSVISLPADVMKTRMMNQSYINGRGLLYNSTLDCLVKTVKGEGFLALYKGFLATWARLAPFQLTLWLGYERIRVLAGVRNF